MGERSPRMVYCFARLCLCIGLVFHVDSACATQPLGTFAAAASLDVATEETPDEREPHNVPLSSSETSNVSEKGNSLPEIEKNKCFSSGSASGNGLFHFTFLSNENYNNGSHLGNKISAAMGSDSMKVDEQTASHPKENFLERKHRRNISYFNLLGEIILDGTRRRTHVNKNKTNSLSIALRDNRRNLYKEKNAGNNHNTNTDVTDHGNSTLFLHFNEPKTLRHNRAYSKFGARYFVDHEGGHLSSVRRHSIHGGSGNSFSSTRRHFIPEANGISSFPRSYPRYGQSQATNATQSFTDPVQSTSFVKPFYYTRRSLRSRRQNTAAEVNVTSDPKMEEELECEPKKAKDSKTIDIAVLVPRWPPETESPYSWDQVIPAVKLAVKHLRRDRLCGPLQQWKIKVHYRDTNCSSTHGPLAAVDLHNVGSADVFLGPVCDYALAPVSRFASHWNTPLLTPGGHAHAFDFKMNFPSLTRLRGFDTEVARVFKRISDHFGWSLIGLLYEDRDDSEGHSTCHLKLSVVHDAFNKTSENRGFVDGRDNLTEIIHYFYDKARIIVLCAQEHHIVREIMLIAKELGMTNGDFAFFNIELFSGTSSIKRPWYNESDTPERNARARDAFRSLFIITARISDSSRYTSFSKQVHDLARYDLSIAYTGEKLVSPYAASFYEAVMIYAQALNSTLRMNGSIEDGSQIIKNLWGQSFTGLITGNVTINENGDRNADYTLLAMTSRSTDGVFKVIAVYVDEKLNFTRPLDSLAEFPLRDRPKCGFHGENCHNYLFLVFIGILCLLVFVMFAFSAFVYRRLRRLTRGLNTLTSSLGEDDDLQMVSLKKVQQAGGS